MDDKQKLQIALQLYYERKYKGNVEVRVENGCLKHLYSVHISVEFNDFKMFAYFDLVDFYNITQLEQEIRKCNETIEQSYQHQINAIQNLIRE